MRCLIKQKNILDESADALVSSANVSLTLSGGVGAELLNRYGVKMQEALHRQLLLRTPRCAERGEVIAYSGTEIPYKVVLHAVAIDGWYESSPNVITAVTTKALQMAAGYASKKAAITALATGFGRLSLSEFAEGVRPLLKLAFPPLEEAVICLLLDFQVGELAKFLPEIKLG